MPDCWHTEMTQRGASPPVKRCAVQCCTISGCLAWLQMACVFPPSSQAFCLMIYHISCFDTVKIRCSAAPGCFGEGGVCVSVLSRSVVQPNRGSVLIAVEWLSHSTMNLICSAPLFSPLLFTLFSLNCCRATFRIRYVWYPFEKINVFWRHMNYTWVQTLGELLVIYAHLRSAS